MSAFTNIQEADNRARVLMNSGVAIVAHGERHSDGSFAVRLLRPMSATGTTADGMNKAGAWDFVIDDEAE